MERFVQYVSYWLEIILRGGGGGGGGGGTLLNS